MIMKRMVGDFNCCVDWNSSIDNKVNFAVNTS